MLWGGGRVFVVLWKLFIIWLVVPLTVFDNPQKGSFGLLGDNGWLFAEAASGSGRDFYTILGVSKNDDTDTIKKAYRKLARIYHPDSNPTDPDASSKFIDVADAHEVLTTPEKKALYDQYGEEGLDPNFNANNPFGGGGGGRGQPFVFRSADGQQFFFQFSGGGGGHPFFPGGGPFGGGGGPFGFEGRPQQQPMKGFYDDTPVVQIASHSSWNREILDDSHTWVTLVNFYSPRCHTCEQVKDEYVALAKMFQDIVSVAAINCLQGEDLCDRADLEHFGTIRLYHSNPNDPYMEYKGEKTAHAMAKWLSANLPSFVTVLSPHNIDAWLIDRNMHPKVVLFTSKVVVPPLFKRLSSEFERQVSFGVVFSSGKALADRFDPPKIPSILHLVDIDKLSGEWLDVTNSFDSLSLKMSRIVTQKRTKLGPYKIEGTNVRELSLLRSRSGECAAGDHKTCLILVEYGGGSDGSVRKAFEDVAESFAKDPMTFFWIDAKFQTKFVNKFGLPAPNCKLQMENPNTDASQCLPALVAYRPKRSKFAVLHIDDPQTAAKSIKLFIDGILESGGGSLAKKSSRPDDLTISLFPAPAKKAAGTPAHDEF